MHAPGRAAVAPRPIAHRPSARGRSFRREHVNGMVATLSRSPGSRRTKVVSALGGELGGRANGRMVHRAALGSGATVRALTLAARMLGRTWEGAPVRKCVSRPVPVASAWTPPGRTAASPRRPDDGHGPRRRRDPQELAGEFLHGRRTMTASTRQAVTLRDGTWVVRPSRAGPADERWPLHNRSHGTRDGGWLVPRPNQWRSRCSSPRGDRVKVRPDRHAPRVRDAAES
jgi:hypothetical protein